MFILCLFLCTSSCSQNKDPIISTQGFCCVCAGWDLKFSSIATNPSLWSFNTIDELNLSFQRNGNILERAFVFCFVAPFAIDAVW